MGGNYEGDDAVVLEVVKNLAVQKVEVEVEVIKRLS